MSQMIVQPAARLRGRTHVPGDKSISHRALLLGALADGASQIKNLLPSGDCMATLACIRTLGVKVEIHNASALTIHGRGLYGLVSSDQPLHCGRSGTSMRLLAGILAGQPFKSTLTGDPQLLRRPMYRIVEPLRRIGAEIEDSNGCAPLIIRGRPLHGHDHTLTIASAQVKSALLLAGLYAEGPTVLHVPGPARDHTERLLSAMGADLETASHDVRIQPGNRLQAIDVTVPGDLSSAAFLAVAATLVPASEIVVENVGVNPTRTGLLDILRSMGAEVTRQNQRTLCGEPIGHQISSSARNTHVNMDSSVVSLVCVRKVSILTHLGWERIQPKGRVGKIAQIPGRNQSDIFTHRPIIAIYHARKNVGIRLIQRATLVLVDKTGSKLRNPVLYLMGGDI